METQTPKSKPIKYPKRCHWFLKYCNHISAVLPRINFLHGKPGLVSRGIVVGRNNSLMFWIEITSLCIALDGCTHMSHVSSVMSTFCLYYNV